MHYRFYVSSAVLRGRKADVGSVGRVPAAEIESAVLAALKTYQQQGQSDSAPASIWLETQLTHIPPRSGLADAIRYAPTRWSALGLFLDDGRHELDNNTVERAIRPIALGRKNHLFAGSDGGAIRWAIVASLLATAKLNDVEPFAYLKDLLDACPKAIP